MPRYDVCLFTKPVNGIVDIYEDISVMADNDREATEKAFESIFNKFGVLEDNINKNKMYVRPEHG